MNLNEINTGIEVINCHRCTEPFKWNTTDGTTEGIWDEDLEEWFCSKDCQQLEWAYIENRYPMGVQ